MSDQHQPRDDREENGNVEEQQNRPQQPPPDANQEQAGAIQAVIQEQDILKKIKESNEWRILVYGLAGHKEEHREHHMRLLNGIIGRQIPLQEQTKANYRFEKKNGVIVTVYFGSHAECEVTHEDVDLLLFFIPVSDDKNDPPPNIAQIDQITQKRKAQIWKHSVAILTGVDAIADSYSQMQGDVWIRLDTLIKWLTTQIQKALKTAIGDENEIGEEVLLICSAGRQNQPDLLKIEKWFSQLWYGCLLSSKDVSKPAILKIAQDRIKHNVKNEDIKQLAWEEQPIRINEPLSSKLKFIFGFGGSSAIAGAAATGASIGAVIGALAIGVPSFGVAATTGLVLGGVIGGGVGAGIAGAAVSGGIKLAKQNQASQQAHDHIKILKHFPGVIAGLKKSASGRVACRFVISGLRGEGISTLAAALTKKDVIKGAKSYWLQVKPETANLVVYDFSGFSRAGDKQPSAKALLSYQSRNDTHLLIFCIPMTNRKNNLIPSPYYDSLKCLSEKDESIFCNTMIALTHANEIQPQDYKNELEHWKNDIRKVLEDHLYLDKTVVASLPIIPVGNKEPIIQLPDGEQYHWRSELFLHAMPFTKPGGLPTLLTLNNKQITEQPREFENLENAKELVIEARCNMFSKIGLSEYEPYCGEAIGLILGENDQQNW